MTTFLTTGQKAPQEMILNGFRLGAARLGGWYPTVNITINGTTRTTYAQVDSLSITEYEGSTPNEARLRVSGFVPSYGHEIKIGIHTVGVTRHLIFAGHIMGIDQVTEAGDAANVAYDLTCIEYTWLLNRRLVSKQYTAMSATAILQDLINTFTSGFTCVNVEAGLPTIDEITFTNVEVSDAIERVMKRIGGYWKIDYGKDLHAFLSAGVSANSVTDAAPHTAEVDSFAINRDLSQVRTRYYGEGTGSKLLAACEAGETILPVEDALPFSDAGGTVKVEHRILTYTGKVAGGGGALVGPGVTPSGAPVPALATGTGVESGVHQYAYTWVTASGETLPSPLANITTDSDEVAAPGAAVSTEDTGGSGTTTWAVGESIYWAVTYVNAAGGETTAGTSSNTIVATLVGGGYPHIQLLTSIPVPSDERIVEKRIYINRDGAWDGYYSRTGAHLSETTYTAYATRTAGSPPGSNTTATGQVDLSGISVGPSGTTDRKIYRTVAAGSQLKLQQTIANNTATDGVTDATADASLGANAPSSDTSGLTQPTGQVNPGATSLIVASTGAFRSSGGWAILPGGQYVRYTGLSAGALTGVPATGTGAILAAVSYNTTVTAPPLLIGVPASGTGAILATLPEANLEIYLVVQRDDVVRQAALAVLTGGDGIVEGWLQDRRLSETEMIARCDAALEMNGDPAVGVAWDTRDRSVQAAKLVTFDLTALALSETDLKIQRVTINRFLDGGVTVWPWRKAEASSARDTFEALVRQIKG
uniref:Putative tail protein n=1 Tax=viral metagenome TaxID=1070528 RepID=A0A6M3J6H6_9ZZZZ